MEVKKIGILTSGGDCGGLNAVIKGAGLTALSKGVEAYLITNGYAGLYNLVDFDHLVKLEQGKPGINILPLVGHGTIRVAAMGMEKRAPTQTELAELKRLTTEAMAAGAFGLSTALILAPASFAQTDEVLNWPRASASPRARLPFT